MQEFKKILAGLFLLTILFGATPARAEDAPVVSETPLEEIVDDTGTGTEEPGTGDTGTITVRLTIRAGEEVFSENIEIPEDSTVLSLLETADTESDVFSLSNVEEYSFGSYLKCITIAGMGEKCDDWQYTINGDYPSSSIDQTEISGDGSVYLYFSAKHRISLSENSISPTDTITVTLEAYDYESGNWEPENNATVGITQPDPSGAFNPPTEIMTIEVDDNGQAIFSNIPIGSYDVGLRDEYGYYFPVESLTVSENTASSSGGSSSGNSKKKDTKKGEVLGAEIKPAFDTKKAYSFLISQQKEDGSFGGEIFTDWAAIALAGNDGATYKLSTISKLVKYFSLNKPEGDNLTDYERRAMALMALGLDPYDTNGINYIQKIVSSFDGQQLGDVNEDNDDIFGLIVLENAGYVPDEEIMKKSLSFVLKRQRENGSWDESIDMTGAALQALAPFGEEEEVKTATAKAKEFLKSTQEKNGSWNDDASSTAWATSGIRAIGEKPENWNKKNNNPLSYLATLQDTDGGIKDENTENKIWKTAYVVSAVSGKTWSQSMQKFEKKEVTIVIAPAKPFPQPQITSTRKISSTPKEVVIQKNETPEITAPVEADNLSLATPPETRTPETKKSWIAKLLGIFTWN